VQPKPASGAHRRARPRPAAKSGPAPIVLSAEDARSQQDYYDLGIKLYAEEDYEEARSAWEQAVRLGPSTPVADKARECLKKTDLVLKTLKEMEKR
jgi:TolA-binding protein